MLLRLVTGARLTPQDLPSSLFQPTSGSCRLYNGRRAASNQVPAALITPPPHEVVLPDDLAISLLHQRFICIHLPDAYLPPQDGFSLTVHHHHLTVTAAQGGLTAPPVQRSRWIISSTLIPSSEKEHVRPYKDLTSWHKQRPQRIAK